MKRRLIIMRHAKSAWNTGAIGDHDRPLNRRGLRDAPHLGKVIATRGYTPTTVISSDATRTRETWDGLMEAMPDALTPRFTRRLYLAGISAVRAELEALEDDVDSALLLGHNPGFSLAVGWLSGEDVELKTAFAAVLECESPSWAAAMKIERWTLVDLLTPRTPL